METILLVYNDQEFATTLEYSLRMHEYDVATLYDAELVETFVEQHSPTVVVLDALLQKMNGFELCQRLKTHPQLARVPVIITSAIYLTEQDLKTGIQFGRTHYPVLADRYVTKPFEPAELLHQIQYLLGKEQERPHIPKVLIVDDEADIRSLLRTTLGNQQYETVEVSSGKECLDLLRTTIPDVILLDYKLPDISGIEVLKQIRQLLPDIGAILMTAYGDEDLAIHAIEEHVDAYIRKPFQVEAMLSLVSQTLKRSQIKRERNRLIAQLRESNREVMKSYAMLEHANRRLRELDRLKSEFLANVGHELRTPLNSIIGFTELMVQGYSGPLNDNQTRQLSMVLNSGNHLLRVLNDVIEVSMLNAGQVVLKNGSVPIQEIIDDVLHELRKSAREKNITVITHVEPHLPDCYCSREKIKLILYNLIDNAIKFSSSGDVTISAFCVNNLPNDDWRKAYAPKHAMSAENYLLVSVKDEGIGIQEEDFDILFDEFRQVDGSLTREYNGTGLGLAISKKLVDLYGGKIWLESQAGMGTTFYFTVPLCNQSEQE